MDCDKFWLLKDADFCHVRPGDKEYLYKLGFFVRGKVYRGGKHYVLRGYGDGTCNCLKAGELDFKDFFAEEYWESLPLRCRKNPLYAWILVVDDTIVDFQTAPSPYTKKILEVIDTKRF